MKTIALVIAMSVAAPVALALPGCSRAVRNVVLVPPRPPASSLWEEPADISRRDLFFGPGGAEWRPQATTFTFVAEDKTGFSPGFDVLDERGISWSVKTGPEAQTEVVTSRILWAIGFHQPPTHYLASWQLTGARSGPQSPGRFRPDVPGRDAIGEWSWYENPFVGTEPFRGLVVANLLLANWDWKTSNNTIYADHSDGTRRYVVRDVGASLGRFTYPAMLRWFRLRGFGQGTRNDLAGFEAQGFIKKIDGQRVEFNYRGIYRDVVNTVTPADVAWTCGLVERLSDAQLADAFRAGGYTGEQTTRYVRKIREKVESARRLLSGG